MQAFQPRSYPQDFERILNDFIEREKHNPQIFRAVGPPSFFMAQTCHHAPSLKVRLQPYHAASATRVLWTYVTEEIGPLSFFCETRMFHPDEIGPWPRQAVLA